MYNKYIDLNWKKWHRIIKVLFFIIIFLAIYFIFTYKYPRYEDLWFFYDRLDNNIVRPNEVVCENEEIWMYDFSYYDIWYKNNKKYLLSEDDVFCSKNIKLLVDTVSLESWFTNYKWDWPSEFLSKDEFFRYILKNDYFCIWYGEINWVNMIYSQIFLDSDMKIRRLNTYIKYKYILVNLWFLILTVLVSIIIYYKGIIYLVYLNRK